MNETIIQAVALLMVFVLAGFLISQATRGLIRLVVVGVLTVLFLISARSMYNRIRESTAASSIPTTPPPQVNVIPTTAVSPTASPTIVASPSVNATPTVTANSDAPNSDAPNSDAPVSARTGLKNVPIFVSPYVASIGGRTPAQSSSSQQADYQPDYRPPANQRPANQQPANQRPANQRPANQPPITGAW